MQVEIVYLNGLFDQEFILKFSGWNSVFLFINEQGTRKTQTKQYQEFLIFHSKTTRLIPKISQAWAQSFIPRKSFIPFGPCWA